MGNADKKRVANEAEHVSSANCSQQPGMMAPNRTDFERNLSRLNKATDYWQEQMKKHWNETNRNEINRQRDVFTNLQQSFNLDSIDEKRLSVELSEQTIKHVAKQREIHDMEDSDMTYKNLAQAQQKLSFAEDRYNKQNFASVREEKAQVAEIDRIKRNIAKLGKYVPLVEERKSVETAIKDLRQEIRSIRSKMRYCRDQMYDCRKKIREIKTPYIDMKKKMYKVNEEKRQIIKQYEQDRQNYILWLQQNNIRGVPSTFPTAIVHEDPLDNFEPFFEQKKTCAKLIRYLRSLKRDCEPISSESHAANSDSDSSADEFPESFKMLKINTVDNSQQKDSTTGHSRKKNYVKKYVKKTVPITHSFDYIKLFHDIQIDFPGTYAEVDETIKVVQGKLNYYNDQTSLEHLEEIERADSPFSSMLSHNGSDLMDMSFISSPRSESSSSLVILDESNLLQEPCSLSDLNFHFPKFRDVN